MKTISVVGPTQSGSTLLFNLLRFVYLELGQTVASCWYEDYFTHNYRRHTDVLIVKIHKWSPQLKMRSDHLFMPIRDVRDAAISGATRYEKGKDFQYLYAHMALNIALYHKWKPYAKLFVYEQFVADRIAGLQSVIETLGVELTEEQMERVLKNSEEQFNAPNLPKKDDKETLLSRNHNTSGGQSGKYRVYFTPEENEEILRHQKVYDFLVEFGYTGA